METHNMTGSQAELVRRLFWIQITDFEHDRFDFTVILSLLRVRHHHCNVLEQGGIFRHIEVIGEGTTWSERRLDDGEIFGIFQRMRLHGRAGNEVEGQDDQLETGARC